MLNVTNYKELKSVLAMYFEQRKQKGLTAYDIVSETINIAFSFNNDVF